MRIKRKPTRTTMLFFTGKSLACGGAAGRTQATGYGVVECVKLWARENAIDLKGKTYILQGFGNVGSYTAIGLNKIRYGLCWVSRSHELPL